MDNGRMKYTIKEVSKKLKIPVGKLREWEEAFSEALYVQRTSTGARLYTEYEIETLKKIKILKDSHINDELIRFILSTNNEVERDQQIDLSQEHADMMLLLQNETIETIQKLTESFDAFKGELIQEVREEIKSELDIGHTKTKSLIQSYSHMVVDTAENTHEEIEQLREDMHREEEEKLFIQQKLEEREKQFQEFVNVYREIAVTKQKQWPNLLKLFKIKKEGSVDFS